MTHWREGPAGSVGLGSRCNRSDVTRIADATIKQIPSVAPQSLTPLTLVFLLSQDMLKNASQQEERLKKMDDIKVVQEANRLLKAERDRLELELQQLTAKVRVSLHR